MASNMVLLTGEHLTTKALFELSNGKIKIDLSADAWERVAASRAVIDKILETKEVVYGINTGFGEFSKVTIETDQVAELQTNLIRSHAAGVGTPVSPERTRMILALRINVLAKGHSGIRPETLKTVIEAFNAHCLPMVPAQGTVGASGDLAQLAHLALGMMGEGQMWDMSGECPVLGEAAAILARHGITPVQLAAKEGLALINGTQFQTALGAEAVERAEALAKQADIVAALSLEAMKGTNRAFHKSIHVARGHAGQQEVAETLRGLLHCPGIDESTIAVSHADCGLVQDSYTLRCIPQVHGISRDTVKFVKGILNTELNAATDNPMVFDGFLISGGNFHGEYPAKSLDYLGIGIHEIANMSERRIERLCNPSLSNGLPAFLVPNGGLNSGFMIPHCTAAALVSENKGLCHPSSVDSISTSAAKEDHVSMGGWSARKALKIVENCEIVVAIEMLAACQGIDLLRPLKTTSVLESVVALVRESIPFYDKDRIFNVDIKKAHDLIREQKVLEAAEHRLEENCMKQKDLKDSFYI